MDHNHKHIMLSARKLASPLRTAEAVIAWLLELVELVEMQVLMGPYSIRCTDDGNEGVTGVVVISTSHAALHCWDQIDEPFFEADLYSCQDFDINAVIEHCRVFGPAEIEYMVIDRNQGMRIIDQGKLTYV